MPLLLLLTLSNLSLSLVANSEVVAVEIVRTIVGSIGLDGGGPDHDIFLPPGRRREAPWTPKSSSTESHTRGYLPCRQLPFDRIVA